MRKIGDRIFALSHTDETKAYVFGEGTYAGEAVPLEAIGVFANAMKDMGIKSPKIELNNGEVVYGCECWFGDVKLMLKKIGDKEHVQITAREMRESRKQ